MMRICDEHEHRRGRFERLPHGPALRTSRPIRICIASDDLVGPIRNGGIGTAYSSLAQTLADAGHDVTLLYTLSNHTENQSIEYWIDHYAAMGIHFVPLPPPPSGVGGTMPLAITYSIYVWLKERQFDIVHFPDWQGRAYYTCLAKRQGLAFAGTDICIGAHSPASWDREGNEYFPTTLQQLETEFMERQAVEMADVVVSPSHYMLEWMTGRGWTLPERTYVEQNIQRENSSCTRFINGQDHKVTEVVFFGRLERRKGLELFCSALDALSTQCPSAAGFAVTFLGKDSAIDGISGREYVRQCAERWPWQPGFITDRDHQGALEYLRGPGRLAVIPSLVDNSPYTVLECLEARVPFLASAVGGIPELIAPRHVRSVCFEPTPAALADCLAGVVDVAPPLAEPAIPLAETQSRWVSWHEGIAVTHPCGDARETESRPLVSVCLLHFNRPYYLRQAVESLYAQDYPNFEVIIVDDGSTTSEALATLDALEADFHPRGWIVLRQENRYLGAARNNAARHAHGRYLLFMDDDNYAKPHEISTFVSVAINTNADILTCNMDLFSGDEPPSVETSDGHCWLFQGGPPALGLFRNCFGDANAFIKADVFATLGGFVELHGIGHEDWELFARATLAGYKLQVIPDPLYWYRETKGSVLRGKRNKYHYYMNSLDPYLKNVPHEFRDLLMLLHGQNVHLEEQLNTPFFTEIADVKSLIRAARILAVRGDFDGAMELSREAMVKAQDIENPTYVLEVMINTGKLLSELGRSAEARIILDDAVSLSQQIKHHNARGVAEKLVAAIQ